MSKQKVLGNISRFSLCTLCADNILIFPDVDFTPSITTLISIHPNLFGYHEKENELLTFPRYFINRKSGWMDATYNSAVSYQWQISGDLFKLFSTKLRKFRSMIKYKKKTL